MAIILWSMLQLIITFFKCLFSNLSILIRISIYKYEMNVLSLIPY